MCVASLPRDAHHARETLPKKKERRKARWEFPFSVFNPLHPFPKTATPSAVCISVRAAKSGLGSRPPRTSPHPARGHLTHLAKERETKQNKPNKQPTPSPSPIHQLPIFHLFPCSPPSSSALPESTAHLSDSRANPHEPAVYLPIVLVCTVLYVSQVRVCTMTARPSQPALRFPSAPTRVPVPNRAPQIAPSIHFDRPPPPSRAPARRQNGGAGGERWSLTSSSPPSSSSSLIAWTARRRWESPASRRRRLTTEEEEKHGVSGGGFLAMRCVA